MALNLFYKIMEKTVDISGQTYKVGDVLQLRVKPEFFHEDDQSSARVLTSLQGFTDENHEDLVVQNIGEGDYEGEVTITSADPEGGNAARLILSKVND